MSELAVCRRRAFDPAACDVIRVSSRRQKCKRLKEGKKEIPGGTDALPL